MDGQPKLEPTGTDLGAAVRLLLDTGDMSGVPWILDTLEELGTFQRAAQAFHLRRQLAKLAAAEQVGVWLWSEFSREVREAFWHDLYTLPSTLDAIGWLVRLADEPAPSVLVSPLHSRDVDLSLPLNERGGQ
jgi:hypothetical protein